MCINKNIFYGLSLVIILAFVLSLPVFFIYQAPAAAQINIPGVSAADHLVPMAANYIGNANSMKFHYQSCRWAQKIRPANRVYFDTREEAIEAGYIPCKVCKP